MSAPRGDDGVTLVELLVVAVIGGVLGSAVLGVILAQARGARTAEELRLALDEARAGADRIRNEARGAAAVDTGEGGSSASLLRLWVDQDADATVDSGERISYALVPAAGEVRLQRYSDAAPAPVTIARRLTAVSSFSYSPPIGDGQPRVVSYVLEVDGGQGGLEPLLVADSVRLRNAD